MANPTTNYGFVLPTPTDLVTDLPADFDVALQGVDTRLKALQPGTTLGDLAYSSATANTNTALAIGSTGDILTVAGGVPTWAAPAAAASGLTYITKQTAADVASLTFDNVFTTTYSDYLVTYRGVRSTSAATTADLYFQYRYAGPTTQTATYTYALSGANSSSANISVGGGSQSQMIIGRNLGNSGYRLAGQMFISGVAIGENEYPLLTGQTYDSWGEEVLSYGLSQNTAREYNGFTITTSSGNIDGTFTLYGLAKS